MCDGSSDCIDGSDELCGDHCAPQSLHGNYTMKVRASFVFNVGC